MISKKLIHFNTYLAFEDSRSLLYDWSIAFIAETKQIYTHGNFYDCDIEDINELNSKIDEILGEIYIGQDYANGVYIAASDGTLTTKADWDGSKTAVGVAVIDDAASFIIGLNHTTSIPWGTNAQGLYADISGLTNYTDLTTAATDMNGIANTDVITAIYSGTGCAAGLAKSQSITYGSDELAGYLGSAGEWLIVLNNHEAVKSAIATAGGTAFQTTSYLYYWSSTEYSSSRSWYAYWGESNDYWFLTSDDKDYSFSNACVVPFYPLKLKQSLKDKLAELEQSIPITTSQLTNDSGFVTSDELPTKLSDLEDDVIKGNHLNLASLTVYDSITAPNIYVESIHNGTGLAALTFSPGTLKVNTSSEYGNNISVISSGDGTQFLSDDGTYKEITVPTKVSELENDVPYVVDDVVPENGVYAVKADGSLCTVEEADESCIGVALITDNQRIMIEKMGEANEEWKGKTYLYWGKNLYQKNVEGITETTDETVAQADFNGLEHTNAIIAAYTEHSVAMDAQDMCSVLQAFNDGDNNVGYSDWYIPAAGQLYEIYTNMANINTALSAMTATQLISESYWSSSENSSDYGYRVMLINGFPLGYGKSNDLRVRFVRDLSIQSVKDRISVLESALNGINISVVSELPSSPVDTTLYLIPE